MTFQHEVYNIAYYVTLQQIHIPCKASYLWDWMASVGLSLSFGRFASEEERL
jgi:hypothetical protein